MQANTLEVDALTLVLPDDGADLLHARLQLASHPVGHVVDIFEHLALLFQLATHVVGLHAKVAYGAEDAIERLVLVVHDLHLLVLLELRIIVLVLLERVGIWQRVALLLRVLHGLLQRLVHVGNLVAHLLHKSSAALHLVNLQSKLVGIMFDGFDAFYEVFEVLAQVLEGLLELLAGFSKLRTVRGRR